MTYYFPDLTDMVQFLVSKGANINLKDQSGFTPLHAASEFGNFILENKKRCCFRLHNYILGHAEQVSFLVENGADMNTKDNIEWTALQRAVENR